MGKQKPINLSFSVGFQIKYCIIVSLVFLGATFLLFSLMNRALGGSYLESLRTLYLLDQNLPLYLSIMALLQICFVLFLALVITLLVSHQIAGPVFRYEAVLTKMISGEFPSDIATRNTDQLKPMVVSLNTLAGRCRETFEKVQALSDFLDSEYARSDLPSKTNKEVLQQKIADVRHCMATIPPERSPD